MKEQLWADEYQKGGVPSSVRSEPSSAVVHFETRYFPSLIEKAHRESRDVLFGLDIGCGSGRNSLYLTRTKKCCMTAIDFVAANIKNIAQHKEKNVAAICHNLMVAWPVETESQDFAIDTFCFKHFVEEGDREFYKTELMRVLKSGGFYVLTLAGDDDGYYAAFLPDGKDEPGSKIIIDPENGIKSRLYSRFEIETYFDGFDVVDYQHKTTPSAMHGNVYPRSTHQFVLCKRDEQAAA